MYLIPTLLSNLIQRYYFGVASPVINGLDETAFGILAKTAWLRSFASSLFRVFQLSDLVRAKPTEVISREFVNRLLHEVGAALGRILANQSPPFRRLGGRPFQSIHPCAKRKNAQRK